MRYLKTRRQSRTAHSRNNEERNYMTQEYIEGVHDNFDNTSNMNISHTSNFVMNLNKKINATKKLKNLPLNNKESTEISKYVKTIPSSRRIMHSHSRGNWTSEYIKVIKL